MSGVGGEGVRQTRRPSVCGRVSSTRCCLSASPWSSRHPSGSPLLVRGPRSRWGFRCVKRTSSFLSSKSHLHEDGVGLEGSPSSFHITAGEIMPPMELGGKVRRPGDFQDPAGFLTSCQGMLQIQPPYQSSTSLKSPRGTRACRAGPENRSRHEQRRAEPAPEGLQFAHPAAPEGRVARGLRPGLRLAEVRLRERGTDRRPRPGLGYRRTDAPLIPGRNTAVSLAYQVEPSRGRGRGRLSSNRVRPVEYRCEGVARPRKHI